MLLHRVAKSVELFHVWDFQSYEGGKVLQFWCFDYSSGAAKENKQTKTLSASQKYQLLCLANNRNVRAMKTKAAWSCWNTMHCGNLPGFHQPLENLNIVSIAK